YIRLLRRRRRDVLCRGRGRDVIQLRSPVAMSDEQRQEHGETGHAHASSLRMVAFITRDTVAYERFQAQFNTPSRALTGVEESILISSGTEALPCARAPSSPSCSADRCDPSGLRPWRTRYTQWRGPPSARALLQAARTPSCARRAT